MPLALCLNMLDVHLSVYTSITVCLLFFEGFDNNGVIIGPRSTRQSNPEEHASHYFNTFSKDMLVQVSFKLITDRSAMKNGLLCVKLTSIKSPNQMSPEIERVWGGIHP